MQVNAVNSSVASVTGPSQADETSRRAEDFSRVLQTAFFGQGSQAVAKAGEQAAQDQAPRTETRPVERAATDRPVTDRPAADRPVERPAERQSEDQSASRDQTAKPSETAPSKPAEKPAKADKADDKPAKDTAAADTDADTAPKADEAPKTEAAKPATAEGETAEEVTPEDAVKPVVAAAPDASLILSLLQQLQAPVVTPAATVATGGETAVPAVAATGLIAPVTVEAALAAQVVGETEVETAPETVLPVLTPVVADATAVVAAKEATETSVAALLSQQQTMTKEDFAAIQQALTQQAESQLQADVQTQAVEPELQVQIVQPAATGIVAPKSEGKSEKTLTVDVQTVGAVAAKSLVDQSALMAMQGDDESADAAQLMQQQMQAQQAHTAAVPDGKFAAALHLQAAAEVAVPVNTSATAQTPAHLAPQAGSVATVSGSQAAQASQHASNQTLARNLNAYVSAGEQVAVQIKRGASEGMDKISIRLDPGNLGHVDIKMEVGHDGRLMAVIAAEKPETLQMLQKDSASLEQSLRDAGLKTDQQSLSFALRDQNQGQDGRDGGQGRGNQRGRGRDDYADAGRMDPVQTAASANAQRAAARGGLDIRI